MRERDEAELSREQLSCDAGPKQSLPTIQVAQGLGRPSWGVLDGTKMPRPSYSRPSHLYWPLDTGSPGRRGGPYSQGHSYRDWQYSQKQGPWVLHWRGSWVIHQCPPHWIFSASPFPRTLPPPQVFKILYLEPPGLHDLNLDVIFMLHSPSVFSGTCSAFTIIWCDLIILWIYWRVISVLIFLELDVTRTLFLFYWYGA